LGDLLDQAESKAAQQKQPLIDQAQQEVRALVGGELNRLQNLARVNPSIREAELNFLAQQQAQALHFISEAALEAQAIRVIIAT